MAKAPTICTFGRIIRAAASSRSSMGRSISSATRSITALSSAWERAGAASRQGRTSKIEAATCSKNEPALARLFRRIGKLFPQTAAAFDDGSIVAAANVIGQLFNLFDVAAAQDHVIGH